MEDGNDGNDGNNKSSDPVSPVSLDLHLVSTRSILFSYSTQPTLASFGLTAMILLLDFQYPLPQVPIFNLLDTNPSLLLPQSSQKATPRRS